MNTTAPLTASRNTQILLPYTLGLIGLCLVVHIIIAARGDVIDLVDGIIFLPVAMYYAAFLYFKGPELRQIRFGDFVGHAVTFGVVNGSWALHAMATLSTGSSSTLDSSWFGPTLAMTGFWSIGLTIHALAAIAQRGYGQ